MFTSKKDKYAGYATSIGGGGDDDEEEEDNNRMDIDGGGGRNKSLASFTAPKEIMREMMNSGGDEDELDPMHAIRPSRKIADREGEYRAQRLNRQLSPERKDAFDPSNTVNGKRLEWMERRGDGDGDGLVYVISLHFPNNMLLVFI